jgi:hypothetical protein
MGGPRGCFILYYRDGWAKAIVIIYTGGLRGCFILYYRDGWAKVLVFYIYGWAERVFYFIL